MVSSKRLSVTELPPLLISVVNAHVPENSRLCVGLSGGRDSVVLLHLLVQAQRNFPFRLSAIHVNHQISPNADRWAAFCVSLCEKLDVPLKVECVKIPRDSGKGLEASAREMRYAAYRSVDADIIALAHHRGDQAETVLLQALRGAGLKGISAMPLAKTLIPGKTILRPLLDVAPESLAEFAVANSLTWIHDESNDDTRFTRNFLRHEIFPRLPAQSLENLARLGAHAAEAQTLLDDLAAIDLGAVVFDSHLRCSTLLALSNARAKNVLRYYFAKDSIPLPNSIQLQEIMHQLMHRQADDQTEITWAQWQIRCFGDEIHFMPARGQDNEPWRIEWQGEAEIELPKGNGVLIVQPQLGAGISRTKIAGKKCSLRSRRGGEKIRLSEKKPRRALKNLLQEASVRPWERAVMPLFFCEDNLAWVPGIGVDINFVAQDGETGLCFEWQRPGVR